MLFGTELWSLKVFSFEMPDAGAQYDIAVCRKHYQSRLQLTNNCKDRRVARAQHSCRVAEKIVIERGNLQPIAALCIDVTNFNISFCCAGWRNVRQRNDRTQNGFPLG